MNKHLIEGKSKWLTRCVEMLWCTRKQKHKLKHQWDTISRPSGWQNGQSRIMLSIWVWETLIFVINIFLMGMLTGADCFGKRKFFQSKIKHGCTLWPGNPTLNISVDWLGPIFPSISLSQPQKGWREFPQPYTLGLAMWSALTNSVLARETHIDLWNALA